MSDEHLQWIADRSEVGEFEDGALIMKTNEPIEHMWILLEGKVSFYMDVNGRLVYYYLFENNQQSGGVGGLLPYSRMKITPGCSYAVGKVRRLQLHKRHFPELEAMDPDLIQRLIGYMTERARSFATTQLQHEKVSALGQLSAGIAHELNNPASAINRISTELQKRLLTNYDLTQSLLGHALQQQQMQNFVKILLERQSKSNVKLTAFQRIGNEDDILDWLAEHNYPENKESAETFTDVGLTKDDLQNIHESFGKDAFPDVLRWLENLLSSQRLLKDLEDASSRISNLVGAIKSHVQMDRANERQLTNLHKDLENTLTLLGYKLRDKQIRVNRLYCTDLKEIPVYIGELNQVWTNIIDNAIFAVDKNGEISIETQCDDHEVTVKIRDNGSGISSEHISRIFDPFFTTKKVGQGTGIGLDLAQRIVKRHGGEIRAESEPGNTVFIVRIPTEVHQQK